MNVLATLLALLAVPLAPRDEPFRDLGFEAALAEAGKTGKVVMIDFFTTWCVPCKKLDGTTWKDDGVRRWLGEKTVPLKIDAEEEVDLARRYRVDAYPSLVFLDPEGEERGRIVGYRDPEAFLTEAADVLAGIKPSDRIREELESGGWDQPMLRQRLGDALVRENRYEEALEHYLWCFDHGADDPGKGYVGVRVSFLVSSIVRLGEKHPPAIAALEERRDAALEKLLGGTASLTDVQDFTAINRELERPDLTLEVYDRLEEVEPRRIGGLRFDPRRRLFEEIVELLVEKRRYADVVAGAGDVKAAVASRIQRYRFTAAVLRDTGLDDDASERLELSHRQRVAEECGLFYEALCGTRADEEAARVAEEILGLDASAATWRHLIDRAGRAERPEIAESLRERALASVAEDEKGGFREAGAGEDE